MKRLIYFTYLGLLLTMLIACQKENISPAGSTQALPADNLRPVSCKTYSYQTKDGNVNLGSIRTDNVFVVFMPGVNKSNQLRILSGYQIFKQLEPEFYTDSGDTLQILTLKPNANCQSVEAMLASLESLSQVKYATPVFNAPPASGLEKIGQTNEFLVTLTNVKYYSKLQQLANTTQTTIVYDFGGGTYLMTTNKNSAGNVLEMSGYFNKSAFISVAEPNFLGMGFQMRQTKLNQMKHPLMPIAQ